jgi:Flp pilus assembly protein TadG
MLQVSRKVGEFAADRDGAVAVVFAVCLTLLCGFGALAVDLGVAFSVKSKMQSELDAAVLAGAASLENDGLRLERANAFLNHGIKKHKLEATIIGKSMAVEPNTKGIRGEVTVRLKTFLAGVIGHSTLDVKVKSTAARAPATTVLDVAMCIDATGSMQPTINAVKNNALNFYSDLNQKIENKGLEPFSAVRIRPIFFRDYGGNYRYDVASGGSVDKYPNGWVQRPAGDSRNFGDDVPMRASADFYNLVNQASNYSGFVAPEVESGGGDDPESGLECLNEAIDSRWTKVGDMVQTKDGLKPANEVYSVVAVWTDQDTHAPSFSRSLLNASYPPSSKMPRDYAGLAGKWNSEAKIPQQNKLLAMFIPSSRTTGGWAPITAWSRYTYAGSLTDGTGMMIDKIVDAIASIKSKTAIARLTNDDNPQGAQSSPSQPMTTAPGTVIGSTGGGGSGGMPSLTGGGGPAQ